jgi:hypothetical protein
VTKWRRKPDSMSAIAWVTVVRSRSFGTIDLLHSCID